ncbi:unnamed protein product [Linum trigynum]|uniref:RING-type E3 ubiquitin transferase n=1 Tax=Linum trigynum TaxID=586398 RepID=A0AAV2G135_9ROSI
MGNTGSINRRQHHHQHHNHHISHHHRHSNRHHRPPPPPPPPQVTTSQYVFAAPSQYPNPNLPPPPPYYPHHHHHHPPPQSHHGYYPSPPAPPQNYPRYPYGPLPPPPAPYVEHQKAVTIRNDVNVKKETIRIEEDEENPGSFLVAFTFDATVRCSITVVFFAKESEDCNLVATREDVFKPATMSFEQGLGQKFKQPCGTGIDFSKFDEAQLKKASDEGVYPLVLKAEACPSAAAAEGSEASNKNGNSQITLAIFDWKEKGDGYHARVMKQILWVSNTRYELQEIYGIENSVEVESGGDESGKECVICLSEPRDTTVLPCRHMCMCSGCAKVLQFQTTKCPICRQPVERLLEIKVNDVVPES